MLRALLIGDTTEYTVKLITDLAEKGFTCSIISHDDVMDQVVEQNPNVLMMVADKVSEALKVDDLVNRIKREKPIPTIALLSGETLDNLDPASNVDDFVLDPWDATEVAARVKRILRRAKPKDSEEIIRCDDLMIDMGTCEVTLSGKLIELTFKEYELLIFLASNRGRVFSREALLDKVWGYDYFGGDRTVDVHIRRLRSKVEDANHSFIETVRNIGYRFTKEA